MKTIRCVISRVWNGFEEGPSPQDWYRDIQVDEVPQKITRIVLQADPPIVLTTCGEICYMLYPGSPTPMAFQEFYRPLFGNDPGEPEKHFITTLRAHGWTTTLPQP